MLKETIGLGLLEGLGDSLLKGPGGTEANTGMGSEDGGQKGGITHDPPETPTGDTKDLTCTTYGQGPGLVFGEGADGEVLGGRKD